MIKTTKLSKVDLVNLSTLTNPQVLRQLTLLASQKQKQDLKQNS